jgi:hypothetical protein
MPSQRTFQAVADVLAGELATAANPQERRLVRNITLSLADVFAQQNRRFDRQRFYDAVGLDFNDHPTSYPPPMTPGGPDS